MPSNTSLSTAQVLAVFIEEIAARGGKVTKMNGDERRLFARSVLPLGEEVVRGDRIKSGVALKTMEQNVSVHPYVYRMICSNGAIVSRALESRTLENVFLLEADRAAQVIREGIKAACVSNEAFANTIRKIRESRLAEISEPEMQAYLFMLKPHSSRLESASSLWPDLRTSFRDRISREVVARFTREVDRSRYSLANAVTSVARDLEDPKLNWELEELGGAILVGSPPETPVDEGKEAAPWRRLVEVG